MDFLVPAIAILVGAAILAPGVIRYFKKQKQNNEAKGCGGCSGCSSASARRAVTPQIVTLKRKQQ